jgi:hypothetical protein
MSSRGPSSPVVGRRLAAINSGDRRLSWPRSHQMQHWTNDGITDKRNRRSHSAPPWAARQEVSRRILLGDLSVMARPPKSSQGQPGRDADVHQDLTKVRP